MSKCYFCEIKNSEEVIFNNEFFFSIFDTNPVSPGHALLITKRHFSDISELDSEEMTSFFDSTQKVKQIIKSTDLTKFYIEKFPKPSKFIDFALENLNKNGNMISGFNYGINEGESAGQKIMHLHIHIFPRFKGDLEDPIGGVRNTILGMGNYKKLNSSD